MKPLMESCWKCEALYGCYYNDFSRCPKVENATSGLGLPFKPKDTSWAENIPFGVFMRLKKMVKELEEVV